MPVQMVFPNLVVADVRRATDFYLALGFTKNDMFSDATTSCVVLNDVVALMLLEVDRFQSFLPDDRTAKVDPAATSGTTAILLGSDDEVDALTAKVEAAGGTVTRPAADNMGMYGSAFADPDGHLWEPFFMPAPDAA